METYNDYLDKDLFFRASIFSELIAHRPAVPSLIDRAYAFQPGKEYLNKIILDSWELRFNTDIVFNGDAIPAGTDLFAVPSLRERFMIFDKFWESIGYDFQSDDKLLDELEFGSLEFRATILCRTSLDEEFQASTNVVIRK